MWGHFSYEYPIVPFQNNVNGSKYHVLWFHNTYIFRNAHRFEIFANTLFLKLLLTAKMRIQIRTAFLNVCMSISFYRV